MTDYMPISTDRESVKDDSDIWYKLSCRKSCFISLISASPCSYQNLLLGSSSPKKRKRHWQKRESNTSHVRLGWIWGKFKGMMTLQYTQTPVLLICVTLTCKCWFPLVVVPAIQSFSWSAKIHNNRCCQSSIKDLTGKTPSGEVKVNTAPSGVACRCSS